MRIILISDKLNSIRVSDKCEIDHHKKQNIYILMLSILHIEFHFKGYVAFSLSLQHTIDSFIRIVFNIVYVMVPSFDENITQIVYIYIYIHM